MVDCRLFLVQSWKWSILLTSLFICGTAVLVGSSILVMRRSKNDEQEMLIVDRPLPVKIPSDMAPGLAVESGAIRFYGCFLPGLSYSITRAWSHGDDIYLVVRNILSCSRKKSPLQHVIRSDGKPIDNLLKVHVHHE